ncbi:MAG: hypothetical protein ACM34A_17340 [Bacillota bacterium]
MFGRPRTIETEIGIEMRCAACLEYWPADPEFFAPQPGHARFSARCLACIRAGYWGTRQAPHFRALAMDT